MSRKSWFGCLFARSHGSAPCGRQSRLAFEPLEQRTLLTTLIVSLTLALGCTLFARPTTATATPPTLEWIEQLGTSSSDGSYGVSADGLGNVYISGTTKGSLGGTNAGGWDAFVSKYDASGSLLWTEQLDTSRDEISYGVSADGLGNVYISGTIYDILNGDVVGDTDAFVSKYDASGSLLWTEQFGTSSRDYSIGVSADGLGNVYISGETEGRLGGTNAGRADAFLSKYDASGSLLWTEQLGTRSRDASSSVSADGLGNIYISGFTFGSLGGTDAGRSEAFVSKYDASGSLLWSRQLGTSAWDQSWGVSADGLGNVYISGRTEGSLGGTNVGGWDAFVSKYDASGSFLWTEQLGTSRDDISFGVSADGWGSVYISGGTYGNLGGTNAGSADAFVSKYDASGSLLWTEQMGTSSWEISYGVSADGLGNVYISGWTYGSLGGTNAGRSDAFVAKYRDVPEPTIVSFDIKPGSSPNSVNLKSKGVLPVAILGTTEFDVTEVDFDSLLFGDPLLINNGGTAVSPLRSSLVDISGDGLLDLTLKFSTRDLVEFGALGSDTIEGLLTGALLDGTRFEGMDSIRLVPPNGSHGNSLQVSTVPEPTTNALALAALCLAMSRRRTASPCRRFHLALWQDWQPMRTKENAHVSQKLV